MALRRTRTGTGIGSVLGDLLFKGLDLITAGSQALSDLADNAQKRAAALAVKLALVMLLLLWVSTGILLALLGLFYLLIDQAGIPRGMVFGAGGVILSLVCLLLLKFAKQDVGNDSL